MQPRIIFANCSIRDRSLVMARYLRLVSGIALVVACGLLVLGAAGQAEARTDIYFAPEDRPGEKVVALYRAARQYIFVAMYGLTYPPAVEALVAAKKRGVDVRVLTDRERLNDPKQVMALETLRLAGIPIRINQHDSLMHLKQVVVDDRVNTSGSMNQTTSGNQYNDERLDVVTDTVTTARAKRKFLSMWHDQERYVDWGGGPLSAP